MRGRGKADLVISSAERSDRPRTIDSLCLILDDDRRRRLSEAADTLAVFVDEATNDSRPDPYAICLAFRGHLGIVALLCRAVGDLPSLNAALAVQVEHLVQMAACGAYAYGHAPAARLLEQVLHELITWRSLAASTYTNVTNQRKVN